MQNDVPADYFANLDMSGRRVDWMQRPELRCGTVDFVATKV
jgi:protein transport protein SEC24